MKGKPGFSLPGSVELEITNETARTIEKNPIESAKNLYFWSKILVNGVELTRDYYENLSKDYQGKKRSKQNLCFVISS